MENLKENRLYENTIIIFTSDHGSHFRTKTENINVPAMRRVREYPLSSTDQVFKEA